MYLQELSCCNAASHESWFQGQGFPQHLHTNNNQLSHSIALPHNCHLRHTVVQSAQVQDVLVFHRVSGYQGLQDVVSGTWSSLWEILVFVSQ